MLALTDRLAVVNREKMLPFADSVYSASKNKTPYLKVGWLMTYSNYYDLKRQYVKATPYVDSAINIIDRQNLADTAWTAYYFAANVHKAAMLVNSGHYSLAIDVYFKIKEIADKPENRCRFGFKQDNNIGHVLYRQRKFEEAKKYFTLALDGFGECGSFSNQAAFEQQFLDNIGLCFINQGNTDSALVYYRKALHVTFADSNRFSADLVQNNISKQVSRAVIMTNMGQVFVVQNKLDSAELFYRMSIAINSGKYKAEMRYGQLAQVYLAGLYALRNRYPEMKQVLADLRKSLDTLRNEEAELGWRRLMAVSAEKKRLPLIALKFSNSYLAFKDSLDQAQLSNNVSDISKELEAKKQETDIVLLQKDDELSHLYLWLTIAISLMSLVIIALVYYNYRKGKKKNGELMLLNGEVSEQKAKLEFAMTELEKSNTDKERILRVVAHDLRDPIGGAASLVDSIINDELPEDDEAQSLKLIEKSLGNSLTLINELLVLNLNNEKIMLDKEPADINETIKQCTALMQLIADKKHQQIKFEALPVPLIVDIDKKRIERTINNLTGNAIKFSQPGETISIRLGRSESAILISVADKGIGISAEMQAGLFNALGNTRRMGTAGEKSFGLGLSVCKQIVEAHNGKIWVESEEGKGTVFYVELPLS